MRNIFLNEAGDALRLVDQTLLPNERRLLTLRTQAEIFGAIRRLAVRGAPAIGITAGYAYYLAAREILPAGGGEAELLRAKAYLEGARPTAVNLAWALTRMHNAYLRLPGLPAEEQLEALRREAERIYEEDAACNRRISEYGLSLLKEGDGVITHCNAGPLATSEYGTSLGPLLLSCERGMHIRVFADETRPLLQGARLTAYELMEAGADVTLICDSMAGVVMQRGWAQAVFVGCDRAAANGDCANKVGTASLAVLAHHYGVPVYFFLPSSTIDLSCPGGEAIAIEEREGREITDMWYEKPMAPSGVKTFNPAFDVTPHPLISGIVTEYGVLRPPFSEGLRRVVKMREQEWEGRNRDV